MGRAGQPVERPGPGEVLAHEGRHFVVLARRGKQQVTGFRFSILSGERAGSFARDAGDQDVLGSTVCPLHMMPSGCEKIPEVGEAEIAEIGLRHASTAMEGGMMTKRCPGKPPGRFSNVGGFMVAGTGRNSKYVHAFPPILRGESRFEFRDLRKTRWDFHQHRPPGPCCGCRMFRACVGLSVWNIRRTKGHEEDSSDYFLARRRLTWPLIDISIVAANISTEQMSVWPGRRRDRPVWR